MFNAWEAKLQVCVACCYPTNEPRYIVGCQVADEFTLRISVFTSNGFHWPPAFCMNETSWFWVWCMYGACCSRQYVAWLRSEFVNRSLRSPCLDWRCCTRVRYIYNIYTCMCIELRVFCLSRNTKHQNRITLDVQRYWRLAALQER